ncbi:MAG: hypothetical protein PHI59_02905 [Candidatus Omnitrophica bacterium]|nr:hypothetical protein [Candidatus Omnitrophota bacterium]
MINKICSFTLVSVFTLAIAFLVSGCAGKKGEERIVASINNYDMTVEDFDYESKSILDTGRMLGEIPVTKEEMLDALIIKEILIQEAVRENLDKEKDFMRSIEAYWEHTLLKDLLTKKSEEIAKKTVVYEDEINRYYEKMKNKIKAKIIVFSDEKYAGKGMSQDGDTLNSWEKEPQKFAISYVVPSKWYILGEGESPLEYYVFGINPDKAKGIVKVSGKWALIVVEETAPNDIGKLASLKNEITRRISAVKGKEEMDQWLESLRLKTRVKIDEKIFNSLN